LCRSLSKDEDSDPQAHPGLKTSLGNLDFYRPLGPMTIQAAEKMPALGRG
jgi:hypothetical protein